MLRRIAVVGDELITGGQISHYEGPVFTFGNSGRQVALIGGHAYCEQCKSTGSISKAGGPRRMNFMGEIALDGDIVLCNCATPPRIVAKLAGEAWYDDEAEKHAAIAAQAALRATGSTTALHHDEQFQLLDMHSGKQRWPHSFGQFAEIFKWNVRGDHAADLIAGSVAKYASSGV